MKGEPVRFFTGHRSLPQLDPIRDPATGCLLWADQTKDHGYGVARVQTSPSVYRPAHVVAWERVNGPVPDGLVIDHVCHNEDLTCPGGVCVHRRCVNPKHLRAVPQVDNVLDGRGPAAINAAKTFCLNGHEFTTGNTYIDPRSGSRVCRICSAEYQARCRADRRAKGLRSNGQSRVPRQRGARISSDG